MLDMMSIEGAVVTIDAMGCQRDIATKIIEKKADFLSVPDSVRLGARPG
jgi:predicted transposase YbfD/YdcC